MSVDERRRTILDAAVKLFRHYGHAKTTIADIAREAHVGVGSVYLEFSSKEVIVEELSQGAHVRVLEAMRNAAQKRRNAGLSDRLPHVLEARATCLFALIAEGQHACELVYCKADGVQSAHGRFREDERALLRQILEEARDDHDLGDVDARTAAALLQRAYATLSPPWIFELTREEAVRVSRQMCTLFLQGLLPRPASRRRA